MDTAKQRDETEKEKENDTNKLSATDSFWLSKRQHCVWGKKKSAPQGTIQSILFCYYMPISIVVVVVDLSYLHVCI